MMPGGPLLGLFGALMVIVGLLMLWPRRTDGDPDVKLTRASARKLLPRLAARGFAVGVLSGFFGIGGGFLIVPGLIGATAMPLLNAIGSSLVSVSAFGLTTSGELRALRPFGLAAGGNLRCRGHDRQHVGHRPGALQAGALPHLRAGIVISVGLYMTYSALMH